MEEKPLPAVVIDNGSDTCKAGFAAEDQPRSVVQCRKNDLTQIKTITNWDDVKEIWHQIFYDDLEVNPEDHSVVLVDSPFKPKSHREKMTEIMFEDFSIPALYVANQAVLSLYASGRVTGVVLESGNCFSHAIPIFEGYQLPHSTQRLGIGGEHLTNFLIDVLKIQGYSFISAIEREIVRDIKERSCYVALQFKREIVKAAISDILETTYVLPDGEEVVLNNERFCCPEALFQPTFINMETCGIHEITYKSIAKCDVDIRKELYSNIVLSGGNTMFPGFEQRLKNEISLLAPSTTMIEVIASPKRKHLVWIGGSILASLPSFKGLCISKKEYDEYGPSVKR